MKAVEWAVPEDVADGGDLAAASQYGKTMQAQQRRTTRRCVGAVAGGRRT